MLKIALLGQQYAAQFQENPTALEGMEVVYCGNSVDEFRRNAAARPSNAIVLDMGQLADAPDEQVRALVEDAGAELVMLTYTYARRALMRSLQNERTRVVQAPLSLSLLRAHLGALLVRERVKGARNVVVPEKSQDLRRPAELLQQTARALDQVAEPPPPRFTPEQLGRLTEIASSVQCECPNQLARIVTSLKGFEEYSRDCENKDDADARMHALLYRQTGAARAIMEEALIALMKHEQISL